MLEEYDPYLSRFIGDVGTCISTVVKAVELTIGVGYFIGGKSFEGLKWIYSSSISGFNELSMGMATVRDEVTEFGASFFRAILLIYYGILKIFESFYITAVDLMDFCFYFTESITRTITQTCSFISRVPETFIGVPQQIIDALSIVGETSVACFHCLTDILRDFLLQIILSPIKVLLLISRTFTRAVMFPVNFVRQMPPSSILGFCVILILAFASRRMLRYLVLRNIGIAHGLISLLLVINKILSFIRLTLKNINTALVSTVVKLNDHEEKSANTKAICVICQDKPVCFMSNPCKHVCLCDVCVHDLVHHDNRCPICRGRVSKYDRVFIP